MYDRRKRSQKLVIGVMIKTLPSVRTKIERQDVENLFMTISKLIKGYYTFSEIEERILQLDISEEGFDDILQKLRFIPGVDPYEMYAAFKEEKRKALEEAENLQKTDAVEASTSEKKLIDDVGLEEDSRNAQEKAGNLQPTDAVEKLTDDVPVEKDSRDAQEKAGILQTTDAEAVKSESSNAQVEASSAKELGPRTDYVPVEEDSRDAQEKAGILQPTDAVEKLTDDVPVEKDSRNAQEKAEKAGILQTTDAEAVKSESSNAQVEASSAKELGPRTDYVPIEEDSKDAQEKAKKLQTTDAVESSNAIDNIAQLITSNFQHFTAAINKQMNEISQKELSDTINKQGEVLQRCDQRAQSMADSLKEVKKSLDGSKIGDKIYDAVTQRLRDIDAHISGTLRKEVKEGIESCFKDTVTPSLKQSCKSVIKESISSHSTDLMTQISVAQDLIRDILKALPEQAYVQKLAVMNEEAFNRALNNGVLSGAIGEGLRSGWEASVIPSIERSCKTVIEKSMLDQQRNDPVRSTDTPIQLTAAYALIRELLQALPEQASEEKLKVLMSEGKFDESFMRALGSNNLYIVSWLCWQFPLSAYMHNLNKETLCCLLLTLAKTISNETWQKITWISEIIRFISSDGERLLYAREAFDNTYRCLRQQRYKFQNQDAERIEGILYCLDAYRRGDNWFCQFLP